METGPAEDDAGVNPAVFAYLAATFLGPVIPLGIYLFGRRLPPFTRHHVAAALNLSLTWLLYMVCCLILGGVLLLDSLTTALVVGLATASWLWVCTIGFLIRGIGAANRGAPPEAPAWICAPIVRDR